MEPRGAFELPPDLVEDPSLKEIPDVPALARAYRDTKSMVGKSLRVPGENATPEERAEFRKAVSARDPSLTEVPADPDKYVELGRARGFVPKEGKDYRLDNVHAHEGVNVDQLPADRLAAARELAARRGFTQRQFTELLQDAVTTVGNEKKATRESGLALRNEWGAEYDSRQAELRAFLEKSGAPEEDRNALANGGMSSARANWYIRQAKALGGSGREIGEHTRSPESHMTEDQHWSEIDKLNQTPCVKDNQRGHPDFKATMQKINDHIAELRKLGGAGSGLRAFED